MKKISIFLILALLLSALQYSCTKKEVSPDPPFAGIAVDRNTGTAPLTVNFTSVSTGEITMYSWTFGDGTSSTNANPTHTYNNAGNYVARLTVDGPGGTSTASQLITVTVPAPVASFSTDVSSGPSPLTVNFTSTSTGIITSYAWTFGDGNTSTAQNPSHIYYTDGTFTASLTVTGPGGNSSANTTITVGSSSSTNITFYNQVFTDIEVSVNGSYQTAPIGGSVTFYSVPGTSATLYAYTSGETTTGTQIGLQMIWDFTLPLDGGNDSYNLNVTSSYFFIYMKNTGTHNLINLYVNYGLSSQTYDNILIPNNSVHYRIGYYEAYTNSNVRMYWQDQTSWYTYWDQGTHFTLPWTENQYADLLNNIKVPGANSAWDQTPPLFSNKPAESLYPCVPVKPQKNPQAKDLYNNRKK